MDLIQGALIKKLNPEARAALLAAAEFCTTATHYDVEVEHLLLTLLDQADGDAVAILKAFEVDTARLTRELTESVDRLRRGNARHPQFSPKLIDMLTEAWTVASINYGAQEIRSGFLILVLATSPGLARLVKDFSSEFGKIRAEDLHRDFWKIVASSKEGATGGADSTDASPNERTPGDGKTPFLDQYTRDLTVASKAGEIDPVLARDDEIRQVIDILMRRRQNNPILVGEAGVGKTAVVEGFALRVANGDVPTPLRNVAVRSLDLTLLQAGAGVKGEFENRLKGLVNEVKSSPNPIILFIDEAHTMIGAGGSAGQGDAANILKPALARGELRTIAATTWAEYKKYFEKDAALSRRFQPVKVEEPDEERCQVMIRGLVPSLEKHHNVRILDEGVAAAVRLSARYLPDRQNPDKAVSVLDTACARLSLGQNSVPPAIEDARRTLDDINAQVRVLSREAVVGADHDERLEQLETVRGTTQESLESLARRWETESSLVKQIREIRSRLEEISDGGGAVPVLAHSSEAAAVRAAPDGRGLREELGRLSSELSDLQGESPMTRVCVDAQIVGEVVASWTGIPLGKMLRDEVETVLSLESLMKNRVIGQDHAMGAIGQRIRTARAGLDDPGKPVGVFMLVGPSGVGKTETALALADLMYGGERNIITINMSEFQEAHTVSALKGSPPGYVGYGEGGVLTEAVRRRPYSVVLLDEIEKAHPDVRELFFQVFDKGTMEDGEGREIDFRNCIVILTSNAGTDSLMQLTSDVASIPDPDDIVEALKPELDLIFKPAFLGRLVIVPYYPLRDESLKRIVTLKLKKIQDRIQSVYRIGLDYEPELLDEVVSRCTEVESGARNVDNILTHTLLADVSRQLLGQLASGEAPQSIHVGIGENGSFEYR